MLLWNMAAPISRLVSNALRKKCLSRYQCSIYVNTERYFRTNFDSSSNDDKQSADNNFSRYLTYSAVISSALGYMFYRYEKDNIASLASLDLFPSVNAASNFLPSNIEHNRDKYNFIADVVEVSAPSVVFIELKDQRRVDFFTGRAATTSNGSGFIVQEDGLILTNAHVVLSKPNTLMEVNVRLQDGLTYTGVIENIDVKSDLATIRINKTNLPVMKLGSSSNLRPGEFVVAIGSPLALSNTITSGIVSSVNRPSEELGLQNKNNIGYIQTDAPITFGNSGGPLVNLSGEAIGINAMKVAAGISFAIPIDYAKEFLQKSEERRKSQGSTTSGMRDVAESSKRRYMGITMLTLTSDIIFELHQRNESIPINVRHGVLVWKVIIGSPAFMGGLKPGDIVTHVNGEPVYTAADIYRVLEKPGPVKLTVVRKSQVTELIVEPEDA